MSQLFSPDTTSISSHHLLRNVCDDSDEYLLLPPNDRPTGTKPRRLSFRGQNQPSSTNLQKKLIPNVSEDELSSKTGLDDHPLLTILMYISMAIPVPGFPQVLQRRALAAITFILASSISLILCSYGMAPFRACLIINSLSGLDAAFAEMYIYRHKRLRS